MKEKPLKTSPSQAMLCELHSPERGDNKPLKGGDPCAPWEGVMMSRKLNSARKPVSQSEVHSPERGDNTVERGSNNKPKGGGPCVPTTRRARRGNVQQANFAE